ncbi:hypothetical protein ABC855_g582 [[Candida] zeylanoides]|jgi:hypothetical protein
MFAFTQFDPRYGNIPVTVNACPGGSYFCPPGASTDVFEWLQAQKELERREAERQRQLRKPRIIKKVETEDAYQLQIFKEQGNFTSYEVQAVKKPGNRVHLVIVSEEDDFHKIFEFSLNEIEVSQIDWEWYKSENVLVLNIPKKKIETNFYTHPLFGLIQQQQQQQREQQKLEEHENKHAIAARKAEEYRRRAEIAKQKAHRKRAEAEEKKAQLAAEKQRRAEEQRKEEQRKAEEKRKLQQAFELQQAAVKELQRQALFQQRKEAEKKAKLEEQKKAKKAAEKAEAEKAAAEKAAAERAAKAEKQANEREAKRAADREQQRAAAASSNPFSAANPEDFLQQVLGALFVASQAQTHPEILENAKKNGSPIKPTSTESPAASAQHSDSDSESINSDDDDIATPESGSAKASTKLTRHPSMEEVEDEEFVMFKKKFGQ